MGCTIEKFKRLLRIDVDRDRPEEGQQTLGFVYLETGHIRPGYAKPQILRNFFVN